MANELEIRYSSGNGISQDYSGEARKSIGGIITPIKIPDTTRNLFGTVSLRQLSLGGTEYRAIYLINTGATAVAATGTVEITNNANITGDTIDINGTGLVEGVDFNAGIDTAVTAENLKDAININPTLSTIVIATVSSNVVTVTALTAGTTGNSITMTYTDSGSGIAVNLSGATLSGGTDAIDVSNLRFYVDVPILAPTNDPSTLTPVIGDKYIVPDNAIGAWLVPDTDDATINTVAGKQAEWDGTKWIFSFAPFGKYQFGFIQPTDIQIDAKTLLKESFIPTIENVFESPAGITFISADTQANETTIGTGTLLAGSAIGMWIKRDVKAFAINRYDLLLDEGGITVDEIVPIMFTYDTP